mmetsp:Transcript_14416/g.50665  ORF Transcript_14416/g.50665 Transcript_14416/m.50665 type:complete len:212 (+) Transcript_14416:3-638(+)
MVAPSRLYVTGLSLGACGSWNLALRFGERLAACAPVSGSCDWPGASWPSGQGPEPDMQRRLTSLPMRAYQIDTDRRAGNPTTDMAWLCDGLELTTKSLLLQGVDLGSEVKVEARTWRRRQGEGATWELWLAKGPLHDFSEWKEWGGDNHCLWNRCYPLPDWDLAGFFLRHRTPSSQCWSFEDAPYVVDTAEETRAQKAAWAPHAQIHTSQA